MDNHRLQALHDAGQSIWLDYIDRTMLHNGDLERRLTDDMLTGMTSNPTIFQKALAEGNAYDDQLRAAPASLDVKQLFELVETQDVRDACDVFADVYHRTNGDDGYVSIEVSADLANNAAATIEEAHRLWTTVNRPNLLVKVPGTVEGAKAVRQLITDGINVNITLLFAVKAHERVIDAYIDGLEARVSKGLPIDRIASVASFFVSRVDTEVDKRLEAIGGSARQYEGKAAIANAKMAYQLFVTKFGGARWNALEAKGARVQRPLWASTSTKNPAYRDVLYVENLIGPNTVNTMPPKTIEDFRDHGVVARTVDADMAQARADLAAIAQAGVSLNDVTDTLLRDGIASFEKSFETLSAGIKAKVAQLHSSKV
ncbi:MAG TPA: transaldolase [Gemmatimonadaceae bacterium]|nr:transaldolase [Gemmatimonadaceae bacterium]